MSKRKSGASTAWEDMDPKTFNEWLALPTTQAFATRLRRDYGDSLKALAVAVGENKPEIHRIAGEITKLEEILAVLRTPSEPDLTDATPYRESMPDDEPFIDPALVRNHDRREKEKAD